MLRYMLRYMSCEPYLLHNTIDGVFLPRSPVPERFCLPRSRGVPTSFYKLNIMFLTNRGTPEYYFPYTQIRAVAHMLRYVFYNLYPFSSFSPCFHGSCWNISWKTCVSSSVAIASATSASCDSHCSLERPLWSKVYFHRHPSRTQASGTASGMA